mmetsp:Transcript_6565/g.10731  ORF Transcript_6565/g.10731 Transcript_6565/m.10731 type:complete len:334 (+) Transcript_6565:56-1057(+)
MSKRYPIAEVEALTERALTVAGFPAEDVGIVTEVLMYAEMRGNNQGLIKLISGALKPNPDATDIHEVSNKKISAKIDGGQHIGMAAVGRGVHVAITKAKEHGMSIVAVNNYSSATGALGVWAKKITSAGLIGIVLSQCPEMVAPHGSYEPIFGTNPLAIGIPTGDSDPSLILDMATSAEAWFGLVTAKENGQEIRPDVAFNSRGELTTSPAEALEGALQVFDRSYKGSHLALMVELLAGALPGAAMEDKRNAKGWGSLIIAIDPEEFDSLEAFQDRVRVMSRRVTGAKRVQGCNRIYLPGERGDEVDAANRRLGTIEIPEIVYTKLTELQSKA